LTCPQSAPEKPVRPPLQLPLGVRSHGLTALGGARQLAAGHRSKVAGEAV